MKKVLIIVFALICLVSFAGCDPAAKKLDADELLNNTVKIELVHYENEEPKLIRAGRRKAPTFDFSKTTLIATLDASSFEDIVTDIAEVEFLVLGRSLLNEPIGKTMILYQRDGNMIVIFGCAYENEKGGTRYYGECNVFDENGVFIAYIGDVSSSYVDALEEKYF